MKNYREMEEQENYVDDEESALSKERMTLAALAQVKLKTRDEAIAYRAASGIERQWQEDEENFDSMSEDQKLAMIDVATGTAGLKASQGPIRSRVVVNVLRARCETTEGRFNDILESDKNYGLSITPVPDLVKGLEDDSVPINTATGQLHVDESGNPVKTSEIARAKIDKAEKAMAAMELEIDDTLKECNFGEENRELVADAIKVGTCFMKGPTVIKKTCKAWVKKSDETGSTYVMQTVEKRKPISKRVDYWNIFIDPHCGGDIRRAGYIWEYDEILPRELRDLIGLDGYFSDQIEAVLAEDPIRTQAMVSKSKKYEVSKIVDTNYSTYEKWEAHCDIDREDLETLDVDCSELKGKSLSACIVFVNDRPIKVQLNVLDSGGLPYDVFCWCPVRNRIWGVGVVRIGTWAQKVIQAAWRTMMDNARDSSGANLVIGRGVEPFDGRWEITGKKLWNFIGDADDIKKVFAQFQIENRQVDLQAIIEMAIKFLDMETALPMMFQGEKGEMPDTLGATNILIDSNNVAIRSRVKRWGDCITRPQITRHYYWQMQYSEKEEIKGDYNVDVKTDILLERDKQAKVLIQVMKLKNDPDYADEIDFRKAVRDLMSTLKLNILKSESDKKKDQEAKKNQPQKADPKTEAANIRVQGDIQKAKIVQESDIKELEFKAKEAETQRQFDREMKQADLQIKQMEFSQTSGLKLSEIKAQLATEASKQNLMRELADKGARTAELTKPPVEPSGRAPNGEAYAK